MFGLLKRVFLLTALGTLLVSNTPSAAQRMDDSWIALSGLVASVNKDGFRLEHDRGMIRVNMDQWGEANDSPLQQGYRVTVYGRLDKDLYERKAIEADSVFVEELDTVFHAEAVDEDVDGYTVTYSYESPHSDGRWLSVTGTVASVESDKLTLTTAAGEVHVNTSGLDNAPAVQKGDRIRVRGDLKEAFFENRAIEADRIVVIQRG